MFRIDGTTMYLTRRDTLDVNVTILNEDGTEYTPTEYDEVRFAVKNNYNDQQNKR